MRRIRKGFLFVLEKEGFILVLDFGGLTGLLHCLRLRLKVGVCRSTEYYSHREFTRTCKLLF